ncbi:MAG: Uma2 family endonuclease [Thermomicrobiales bacterium]
MASPRITVAEFEATCGDDRVELIDGVVVQMPAGSVGSARISTKTGYLLGTHVFPRKLGQFLAPGCGFVLFPNRATVLAPDGAFLRAGREPQGEALDHFVDGPPDLAIEVLAPADRAEDMADKVAMYQEAGVPLIWLVDR